MKYLELKEKHEKMLGDFPIAFAFSNEQLVQAMDKLGAKSKDDLCTVPYGGLILKDNTDKYRSLLKTIKEEEDEAIKDDQYLSEGFYYELNNHEYCITYDVTDTLACFGLTYKDVEKDERILSIFTKACAKYLENCW